MSEKFLSHRLNKKLFDLFRQRLTNLLQLAKPTGKFLDIGSGNGIFLHVAKQHNLSIVGIDRSPTIRKYLQKQGNIIYNSLDKIANNSINAITIFDVIEHNRNPQKLLNSISLKLVDNGTLMITTPNSSGFSGRLIKNTFWRMHIGEHYFILNPKSLVKLLNNAGFRLVRLRTNTIHWWFISSNRIVNIIVNKIVFLLTYPFQRILFESQLGDNIEIIAQKIK